MGNLDNLENYERYLKSKTPEELHQIAGDLDRDRYPERLLLVEKYLKDIKDGHNLESLFRKAKEQYEAGEYLQEAVDGFQEVIDRFPGSLEADNAAIYIQKIKAEYPDRAFTIKEGNKRYYPELELKFQGSAGGYFRIWIVNLCLTLLSLGIFSAWAKVRKKRYFYSNLVLDGTPFQYLGQPLPIFKGRLIAAVLFLLYYSSSHFFTTALPYVFAAGVFIAPWVIVKSAAFNARYSAFRNITFLFHGKYTEALKIVCAWGIVPAFVIGSYFDWWGRYWAYGVFVLAGSLLFPLWLRELKHFIFTKTSYGGIHPEFKATDKEFFGVYFMAGLIVAGTLFVVGLTVMPFVSRRADFIYAPYIIAVPAYAGYIMAFAYIQANLTNKVWNKTELRGVSFWSNLRTCDLAKLYLTNAIGIIVSAGLLIPWAVIRTVNYRVENTKVINRGSLMDFHGSEGGTVLAAGAELGDFFDMDLAI